MNEENIINFDKKFCEKFLLSYKWINCLDKSNENHLDCKMASIILNNCFKKYKLVSDQNKIFLKEK